MEFLTINYRIDFTVSSMHNSRHQTSHSHQSKILFRNICISDMELITYIRKDKPRYTVDEMINEVKKNSRRNQYEETKPDAPSGLPDNIYSDGLATSLKPSCLISNTPISLVDPNLFFTLLNILYEAYLSPSK